MRLLNARQEQPRAFVQGAINTHRHRGRLHSPVIRLLRKKKLPSSPIAGVAGDCVSASLWLLRMLSSVWGLALRRRWILETAGAAEL